MVAITGLEYIPIGDSIYSWAFDNLINTEDE
jgi:hypothetical protein